MKGLYQLVFILLSICLVQFSYGESDERSVALDIAYGNVTKIFCKGAITQLLAVDKTACEALLASEENACKAFALEQTKDIAVTDLALLLQAHMSRCLTKSLINKQPKKPDIQSDKLFNDMNKTSN